MPDMVKVKDRAGEEVEILTGIDLVEDIRRSQGGTDSRQVRSYLAHLELSLEETLKAFGIEDLGKTPVSRFLTNTGLRPLFSPVVEDGMRLGMELVAKNWKDFIARTVNIDQMSYTYYYFDNTDEKQFELRKIGQGAPIPVARVTVGDKSYVLYKIGRGIEWTDEAKAAPIDLAVMWFQELGRRIGLTYWEVVVEMLVNGYFADGSDAPPTYDFGTTLTWEDLVGGMMELEEEYGYTANRIVCNKATALNIVTMKYGDNSPIFRGIVETGTYPTPLGANLIVSKKMVDNQVLFVDTTAALIQLVQKPFSTEFERSAKTQTEGSYGTEVSCIVPMFKNARLLGSTS